jgi:hypothetical protein
MRRFAPLYWLAAFGLTYAASAVLRRRAPRLSLPERAAFYADDLQLRVFA